MTEIDIPKTLAAADLFAAAPHAAIAALAAGGRTRDMKRGETLFLFGDEGSQLFLVLSGRVLLSRVTSEGKEVVLAGVEAGQVFGEMSLLDGSPRSATATVAEAGALYVISRGGLLDAIRTHPDLALSIMAELGRRIRTTNRLVESISFLELGPRLARLLTLLAKNGEHRDDSSVVLGAKYTQSELGKRVAASRESVSKQIAEWGRKGLLDSDAGRIIICDLERIEDIADEWDPDL